MVTNPNVKINEHAVIKHTIMYHTCKHTDFSACVVGIIWLIFTLKKIVREDKNTGNSFALVSLVQMNYKICQLKNKFLCKQ